MICMGGIEGSGRGLSVKEKRDRRIFRREKISVRGSLEGSVCHEIFHSGFLLSRRLLISNLKRFLKWLQNR